MPNKLENTPEGAPQSVVAVVNDRLTQVAFSQLAGQLAGYAFVKVVVDKAQMAVHFINNEYYKFHAQYIAERILNTSFEAIAKNIDAFNNSVYVDPNRQFYLGILALHKRDTKVFFSFETVEVDTMDADMLRFFYNTVKNYVDPALRIFLKPANHHQEAALAAIDPVEVPRVTAQELFSSANFVALNPGTNKGRIRAFASENDYRQHRDTILWHDIIVMQRVPDDIPRVAGIINGEHTTPLSHTNVLASGWKIPNAIQLDILKKIEQQNLDNQWVSYTVNAIASEISLLPIERPAEADQRPIWSVSKIKIEEPSIEDSRILPIEKLRITDRAQFGTKAANLGELFSVLRNGSNRVTGFYRVSRPPRANLLPYLAKFLSVDESENLNQSSIQFLQSLFSVPRGIAIPFALQRQFLESSPKIQQAIGKLKMALELGAREVDALCVSLQQMILGTKFPNSLRSYIDDEIANHLSGVSSFVVRSSSNAEDLENFSAAGIYESINHCSTAENIFESIKIVWASLLSVRSTRLRHEVGISLDDAYMGVIIQEEVDSRFGGVLVTTNPTAREDFRNVYLNISTKSVQDIVQGSDQPLQYLFNTVEGGGRTISLGNGGQDLTQADKLTLQKLAVAGRLLQSHFSPDYTYSCPVDIEWIVNKRGVSILQLRPFAN